METATQQTDIRAYKRMPYKEDDINLNWPERYISVGIGAKLLFSGFKGIFKHPFVSFLKLGAGSYLLDRGISGHCSLYDLAGKNTQEPVDIIIKSAFHIDKSRKAVYDFWRKLDNLPMFMNHLESVEMIDDKRSHWVLRLPTGVANLSWDAEIVKDKPNEVIGWSSLPGSVIDNAGKVFFRDAADGRGTLVDVIISYRPPAGGIGAGIAGILNPVFKKMVDDDVRNFKQYMDIDSSLKPLHHNGNGHHKTVKSN